MNSTYASVMQPVAMSPEELAADLWGPSHRTRGSWGARRVRVIARVLYGPDAPGLRGPDWTLSPEQQEEIRSSLQRVTPPSE